MAVVSGTQDRNPRTTKPFLGGWKNTLTGLIYHNACTQTHGCGIARSDGITQTVAVADAITEVVHDQAVQVQFLPDARDRVVTSGVSYLNTAPIQEVESSALQDNNQLLLDSVLKIQRCFRAHRARARRSAAKGTSLQAAKISQEDNEATATPAEQLQALSSCAGFTILNRRSPRTSSDFESLRNLLDRWRILESERASRTLLGASRVAACGLILSKEVELLRAMDSMRSAARVKYRERKRRRLLDELSKPVAWQDSRGRAVLVDTLRVQRARQHRNVYASLANENLSVPERLDLLCGLRRVAGMHTCSQSLELAYLVDQELALLTRRVDTGRLNWLRNRLKLSFLKLARNALQGDLEEDSRFSWLDASITRLCRTCGRLLPLEKFPRERRLRSSICVYCTSMRTRREPRVVYDPYERMLREIRRCETRTGCYGSLAFVIGAKVVYRLVNEIWHGRSGISECDDLDELRLTRFRRELEWAPWNSLLLTTTEAAVHHGIADIENFYDARLLRKFHTKNLQARMRFGSVSEAQRNIVTPSSMDN
ncbi:IQ and ubiquitin-like domain-containing protein [Harpegnathos saltator]|uniref:IQ and ubiquitin-like domain-containing protein n=1 Tax=Harpegnathos saltator TaxID=610380 RepID=E2BV57_HARSA|nr:IQ and ubiquitin-like domain-containing protein [Harpegnathos saltator]EFN80349.1 IQ and ubiquitin-like domain-containing protein [Harpegnathos saltator]